MSCSRSADPVAVKGSATGSPAADGPSDAVGFRKKIGEAVLDELLGGCQNRKARWTERLRSRGRRRP